MNTAAKSKGTKSVKIRRLSTAIAAVILEKRNPEAFPATADWIQKALRKRAKRPTLKNVRVPKAELEPFMNFLGDLGIKASHKEDPRIFFLTYPETTQEATAEVSAKKTTGTATKTATAKKTSVRKTASATKKTAAKKAVTKAKATMAKAPAKKTTSAKKKIA